MIEIKSERFKYVRLNENHASLKYLSWLNSEEINKYLEIRHSENTLDSLSQYLSDIRKSECEFLFGIFYCDEHIGNIKIGPVDKQYLVADIGLIIGDKAWWNKGVATEAISTITQFGFENLGLKKIEAGCYETNLGSKNAFLKCGYHLEGLIREHFILNGNREGCFKMGMTHKEWRIL